MARFKVGQAEYQSSLLEGTKQALVLKRLAPTFAALVGAAPKLRGNSGALPEFDYIAQALEPVTVALAKMPDEDVEFILTACYEVTERKVDIGVGWVRLLQSGDDYDKRFATRIQVAWNVISENFSDMFQSFGLDVPSLRAGAGLVQ